jgi:hypothetical protein
MTIHRPTKIHFSELPPSPPDSPRDVEWETYRREVARLIDEGHEGKWVLIKNDAIIGVYNTLEEVRKQGYGRYFPEGFLIHQIQTWEKVYCIRNYC